jgi:hypothetical protein
MATLSDLTVLLTVLNKKSQARGIVICRLMSHRPFRRNPKIHMHQPLRFSQI